MPILGVIDSGKSGHLAAPNSYASIQTVTVGVGGASSITFSSIPSTYTHLQIRSIAQATTVSALEDITFYLNSDTTYTNYYSHRLSGNGTSASAAAIQAATYYLYPGVISGSTSTNIFGGLVVDILDYANTSKNKTTRTLSGVDLNGSGQVGLTSGLWMSTAAVTSVTFQIPNALKLINQYSSFALYGVK
jgi:hypothetical protein